MEYILTRKPTKKESIFYKQVYKGVYLKKGESVERYWIQLLSIIFSGKNWYISDRTALDLQICNNTVFIRMWKYNRTIIIDKLRVNIIPIDDKPIVVQYSPGVFVASYELALLQNCLEYSKERVFEKKELIRIIKSRKVVDITMIDKLVENNPNYKSAKERFFYLYGQIIGTKETEEESYIKNIELLDTHRSKLFKKVKESIERNIITNIPTKSFYFTEPHFSNYCFWESYFSNYIEGTRFEVEEAKEIIESPQTYTGGPEGHNIYKLYNTIHNLYPYINKSKEIETYEEFKELLCTLHKSFEEWVLPSAGTFKKRNNTNGAGYTFVAPESLDTTLEEGFYLGKELGNDYQRALFYHLVVAECHPFEDGNGRVARLILNFYILKAGLHPLIVTSRVRDWYLSGLGKISKEVDYDYYSLFFNTLIDIITRTDFSQEILDPQNYMRTQEEEKKEVSSMFSFLFKQ